MSSGSLAGESILFPLFHTMPPTVSVSIRVFFFPPNYSGRWAQENQRVRGWERFGGQKWDVPSYIWVSSALWGVQENSSSR